MLDVPSHILYLAFNCGKKEVTITVNHCYSRHADGSHIVPLLVETVETPATALTTRSAPASRRGLAPSTPLSQSSTSFDRNEIVTRQSAASILMEGFCCTRPGCPDMGKHCLIDGNIHHSIERHKIFTWLEMIEQGTASDAAVPETIRNRIVAKTTAREAAKARRQPVQPSNQQYSPFGPFMPYTPLPYPFAFLSSMAYSYIRATRLSGACTSAGAAE